MYCHIITSLIDYSSRCEFVFDVSYIVLKNILQYVMCIVFGISEKNAMPGILSSTVYEALKKVSTKSGELSSDMLLKMKIVFCYVCGHYFSMFIYIYIYIYMKYNVKCYTRTGVVVDFPRSG